MHSPQQKTPHDILSDCGGLLVRRVVERDDEITDALMEVATAGRTHWTYRDAERLVHSLKTCQLTVAEWLKERETGS